MTQRLFLILTLLIMTGACQSPHLEKASSKIKGKILLSANTQGQPCIAEPENRREYASFRHTAYSVICKGWRQESASIVVVPTGPSSNVKDLIRSWANDNIWRQILNRRLNCFDSEWVDMPHGQPGFLLQCRLKKGGWPHILLVTITKNNNLVLADGVPTALSAMESAAVNLFDSQTYGATEKEVTELEIQKEENSQNESAVVQDSVTMARLENLLEGVENFGANDFQAYQDLSRLGQLYNSLGNHQGAENAYRQALNIQEKVLGINNPETVNTLLNLALEVSNQKRFDEATGLLNRAEPLAQLATDEAEEARFALYNAFHNANQHKYESAIRFARLSCALRIAMFEEYQIQSNVFGTSASALRSSSRDITEIAQCRFIEANMLQRIGKLQEAEASIKQALRILGDSRRAPEWWVAQVLISYGQIVSAQGRFSEGIEYVKDAISIRTGLFDQSRPTAIAYQALGEIQLAEGKTDDSLESFRKMAAILGQESVRGGLNFEQISPYLLALLDMAEAKPTQKQTLYKEMLIASQLIEEGVTGQTIARTTARLAATESGLGGLMRKVQEATAQRDEYRFLLGNAQSKVKSDQIDQELNAKIEKLQDKEREYNLYVSSLEKELMVSFPQYSQLSVSSELKFEEISEILESNEGVLTYSIGDQASFVFLLRRDGIYPKELDINLAELSEFVKKLRRPFDIAGTGTLEIFDMELSHKLYKLLLGPIENQLEGITHLIIQPVGSLLSMPFGMLITAPPPEEAEDYEKASWFSDRFASSVVPTLRSFIELRRIAGKGRAPLPFIGFGNPTFQGGETEGLGALAQHCGQGKPIPPALLRGLAPLPETAQELQNVAAALGPEKSALFLAEDATEENVRAAALDQYRVIFFATHGLLPGELACQSEPALALSPPVQAVSDPKRDGLLDSTEIARLQLNADLVVLSACNTGGGGTGKLGGEALSGLARSFFFAGARTLMVSHWVVPSRSAVLLTSQMFQILGDDGFLGTAEAMRQSQMRVARSKGLGHPVFWAPFTIVGDGGVPFGLTESATLTPSNALPNAFVAHTRKGTKGKSKNPSILSPII